MRLAKFILGLLFLFVLIGVSFTIFMRQNGSTTISDNQAGNLLQEQPSDEDITYSQEVRTYAARTKAFQDELERRTNETKEDTQKLKQEINKLQQELSDVGNDKVEQLSEKINELITQNNNLKTQNEKLHSNITELQESVLSNKDIDINELSKTIKEQIKDEISTLEESLSSDDEENEDKTLTGIDLNTMGIEDDKTSDGVEETKVERVNYQPYGVSSSTSDGDNWLDNVPNITGVAQNWPSSTNTLSRKNNIFDNNQPEQTVFPIYTLPITTMLNDAILLTPLIGRVPIDGNVNDPFKFQVELGAENLAANGHRIPGVAKVIAAGSVIGNREQSCVRGTVNVLTFIFEDGRISTVKSNSNNAVEGLAYLADPWGKACIRGEYINNASQYLQSRSMAAFLQGLANAYGQSQMTYDTNDGITTRYVSGNTYQFAAAQGISATASDIAEYVRERALGAFDVVYVPQAQTVQLIVEEQIEIDYDTNGRKISYLKEQNGVAHD